jgi:glycerate kinase
MTSTADVRVLIAPQEFKGTLTAVEAAAAIARGLAAAFADWQLDQLPLADGGPGTVDALLAARGGELRTARVHDPLMRPVDATWGLLPDGTAVIECAAASGLLRLATSELDARAASSFGSGELIAAALAAACRELIFGLGGSATNDGGAGLAQALGFRLLDAAGKDLPPGGAALSRLARIDRSRAHPRLAGLRCLGATDVTNPLCGATGASAVYGPQKGADAAAIAELDAALANFAAVVARDLGVEVRDLPGAGAAGGLGAGLIAFLGAELRPGAQLIGAAAGIEERVPLADIVITGEGQLDAQTAFGKTPQYVGRLARAAGKPAVCLAGALGPGYEASKALFSVIESLSDGSQPLPSPEEAAAQLSRAALAAVLKLVDGRR